MKTSPTANAASLIMQGHWQIDALCTALINAADQEDTDGLEHVVRAMVLRINELNGQMMFSINGNEKDLQDLRHAILGSQA